MAEEVESYANEEPKESKEKDLVTPPQIPFDTPRHRQEQPEPEPVPGLFHLEVRTFGKLANGPNRTDTQVHNRDGPQNDQRIPL